MKIFLRREGGQIPTYCPQGTIDTDHLSSEEAKQVIDILQSDKLKNVRKQTIDVPDTFEYFIRIEQADGSVEEFQVRELALDSKSQKVLRLLTNKIQKTMHDS